jgi:AraC family transcriptional regulator, regulatory protein of adaptative response / methylated-DNA-[protein]-cysteine methyltransferase
MTIKLAEIHYVCGQCSLGSLLYAVSDAGICAILLGDDVVQLTADLTSRFPGIPCLPAESALMPELQPILDYIDAPVGEPMLSRPLAPVGTPFQRQVWASLRKVGSGETISYAELARRIGRPAATRAVAGACAANPLAIITPCHRVLRSDGGISGYRWGVERKQLLIERERRYTAQT